MNYFIDFEALLVGETIQFSSCGNRDQPNRKNA